MIVAVNILLELVCVIHSYPEDKMVLFVVHGELFMVVFSQQKPTAFSQKIKLFTIQLVHYT